MTDKQGRKCRRERFHGIMINCKLLVPLNQGCLLSSVHCAITRVVPPSLDDRGAIDWSFLGCLGAATNSLRGVPDGIRIAGGAHVIGKKVGNLFRRQSVILEMSPVFMNTIGRVGLT